MQPAPMCQQHEMKSSRSNDRNHKSKNNGEKSLLEQTPDVHGFVVLSIYLYILV